MVGVRRGKLKLQFIMDRTERKRSMKKRLPVLVKKAREFSVLCDVPTCLVAYLPGEEQPVTWPSPEGAEEVVRQYKAVGELQRYKHKLDGPDFIGTLVDKAKAELATAERRNRDKETNLFVANFFAGRREVLDDMSSPEALASLERRLEEKLRNVEARLQEVSGGGATLPPLPAQLELVQAQPPPLMMAPPLAFSPNLLTPLLQDGSGLPTTEELQDLFVKTGIFTSPQPNPFFNDTV